MPSINKLEYISDQHGVYCRAFQPYNICIVKNSN